MLGNCRPTRVKLVLSDVKKILGLQRSGSQSPYGPVRVQISMRDYWAGT